jgi:metalloprotease
MGIYLTIVIAVVSAVVMMWLGARQTTDRLLKDSVPLTDEGLLAEVARLAHALGLPKIEVRIYEAPMVNGLAGPDGRVFLTRGFVNRYRLGQVSAAEMAGVVAHELGHVALGHVRRRMIDFTGMNAVFVVMTALFSRFLPIIGIWVANAISTAVMASLSRRDEFEADAWASALLVKAGIGTEPQKSMFLKLDHMTGGLGEGIPAWMRSHPPTPDRIAAIEANEARWGLT